MVKWLDAQDVEQMYQRLQGNGIILLFMLRGMIAQNAKNRLGRTSVKVN